MVGDERQSIYRFRGADVEVFRRRKEASDLGQHRLDTNYRSRPEILAFINQLFSQDVVLRPGQVRASRRRPRSRDAGREPGEHRARFAGPTEVLVAERPPADGKARGPESPFQQAEAHAVAERVRRLVDEEGFSQGDIVLLLPSLTDVSALPGGAARPAG